MKWREALEWILSLVPIREGPMSWLIAILRDVPDPRSGNATRHELVDILMNALTASIRG
jgi:hypothetical protein